MTKTTKGKKKFWSYSAGKWGKNRVRAYEDSDGQLFLEYREPDPKTGEKKRQRAKLKHRDTDRAEAQADEAAAKLARSEAPVSRDVTLQQLFDKYGAVETPHKSERSQGHDRRTLAMFLTFFGSSRPAKTLTRADWDRFIRERRRGATGPWGKATGKTVSDRTVERDLKLLNAVMNWATQYGDRQGRFLLDRNPFAGCKAPKPDPKQPTLSDEEYSAIWEASSQVDWRCRGLLMLAHATGRRIGSIRQLRWSDLDFDKRQIRWRAQNEKTRRDTVTPLPTEAHRALQEVMEERPGVGEAWVFPAPEDASKPCSRNLVKNWWYRMEELAEVPRVKGRGWHSLRRKLVTDLADEPLKKLMGIGGWSTPAMVLHYQQLDVEDMRDALESRGRRVAQG